MREMTTKTVSAPNFSAGMFMAWNIYTQTSQLAQVTLHDSSTTYVNASKQRSSITPPLSIVNSTINGNNMGIKIDEPHAQGDISISIYTYPVVTDLGGIARYGLDLVMEDAHAVDHDYNDLFINLIAWNHKG
jgi:hypothetical protein